VGKNKESRFRIIVTDSRYAAKTGKFLEVVGAFDPEKNTRQFDKDRILYWIGQGAQASGTIHNMLVSEKMIQGKKINVLPKKRPIKKEGEAAAETQAQAAPEQKEEAATPAV
jgi:small subunit ribosomal protein S16